MPRVTGWSRQDVRKLNRTLDRIEAGVSVFDHTTKVAHHHKRWEMDGLVGTPRIPHFIQPHTPWFTDP